MATHGYDWQPGTLLVYIADVMLPEFRDRVVGQKITTALDHFIKGLFHRHIAMLKHCGVRMSATDEHWVGTGFTGPIPDEWFVRRIEDVLTFESVWFGNNVKIRAWLGPMSTDAFILKSF